MQTLEKKEVSGVEVEEAGGVKDEDDEEEKDEEQEGLEEEEIFDEDDLEEVGKQSAGFALFHQLNFSLIKKIVT